MIKKLAKNRPGVLRCEALEPRVLFSADAAPGLDPAAENDQSPDDVVTRDIQLERIASENAETVEHTSIQMRWELVVINGNVTDKQTLLEDIQKDKDDSIIEVITLDADKDGISQISDILANRSDLSAVHIVTHGADGKINLGSTWLDQSTLEQNTNAFAEWGNAMSNDSDILFYGCRVAAGGGGQTLLDDIAQITGADVAASDDITGHADLGGDWDLEYSAGVIETDSLFNTDDPVQWQDKLAANTAPTLIDLGTFGTVTTDFNSHIDIGYSMAVQTDNKIVVAGMSRDSGPSDYALVRYNPDGSIDTDFGVNGMVTTDFYGTIDKAYDVVIDSNDKILVTGMARYSDSTPRMVLVRYNDDGTLDTTFGGGDGIVEWSNSTEEDVGKALALDSNGNIVVAGYSRDGGYHGQLMRYDPNGILDPNFSGDGWVRYSSNTDFTDIIIQDDDKILVTGYSGPDFLLLRYDTDGALDTDFGGGDGITSIDILGPDEKAKSVALDSNDNILIAGYSSSVNESVVIRYTSFGALDTTFGGGDGYITSQNSGDEHIETVTVQSNGQILTVGGIRDDSDDDWDVQVCRYDSDGSVDTGFGTNGMLRTQVSANDDYGYHCVVQDDGSVLVAGYSNNGSRDDFLVLRYNSDFSLPANVAYTENGSAVLLETDSASSVADAELDALNSGNGNYSGATITLTRNGGADSNDVFSFSDGNGITLSGSNLIKNSQIIATFDTTTTAGQLVITFTDVNGEIPTTADVNNIVSQITYTNSSDAPSASVQIDWTIDDGNTGSQGTGGALQATTSTLINITAVNDAPVVTAPGSAFSATENSALNIHGTEGFRVTDADDADNGATATLSVDEGALTVSVGSSGVSIIGDSNNTKTVEIAGTIAQINSLLTGNSTGTITYLNDSDTPSASTT
ncbi:MAG: DUF4347 domain-containing protein, partial [Desulfobacteraceae bacterium]|nr:DUF4347 domain-containing protein [Desulfobacteraceae bacterium]